MPKTYTGAEIVVRTSAALIWLTFGLFHIFSVVESLGTDFISVGEYVTSYASLIGGLGLIAFLASWMGPSKEHKRKSYAREIWGYGSIWRSSVWPVLFWSMWTLTLVIVIGAVLTSQIGFYTRPLYSAAINVLGPTDSVINFHIFSGTLNGLVFFNGIPALHTFFAAYALRVGKVHQRGDNMILVVDYPPSKN